MMFRMSVQACRRTEGGYSLENFARGQPDALKTNVQHYLRRYAGLKLACNFQEHHCPILAS
jgi:hypothetical protein